jgi:hypothetical protein
MVKMAGTRTVLTRRRRRRLRERDAGQPETQDTGQDRDLPCLAHHFSPVVISDDDDRVPAGCNRAIATARPMRDER